jgi:large subunit ribosomal protein L14e
MLNDIGRICVKLAGRDAGKRCIIVDVLDKNNVLIDGNTRRKKCNVAHLEPTNKILELKKNASHDVVVKLFQSEKMDVKADTKPKKAAARVRKQHIMRKEEKK